MALSREDIRQMVRTEAIKQDIDPDLAERIARRESNFNPQAVSKAGARGVFQLMPGTARELGVDPDDPRQNIAGGLRYFGQQLKRFGGDTRLALAAYNAGPGSVQRYGGIPPFAETKNYVASILGDRQDQPLSWFARQVPPARREGTPARGFTAQEGGADEGIAPLRVTPEEGLGEVAAVTPEGSAPVETPAQVQVMPWWGLLGEAPSPAPVQEAQARGGQDWASLLFG